MRIVKRTASIILMIVLLVCINPVRSFAGQKVNLIDMHSIASDSVEEVPEGITDSYGNKYYSNILQFWGDDYAYIIYDLNGKYTQFDANIVCREETSSESSFYVGIFVDGVLKYELDGFNKRKDKQTLSIDVTGAGQLAIKTADINKKSSSQLCFVQSTFTKADEASSYPTRYILTDIFEVDSNNVRTDNRLFVDSLGKVHNGYIKMSTDTLYGSSPSKSYVLYNLDKKYSSLSGKFVVGKWDKGVTAAVSIYLDDELVFSQKDIASNSDPIEFDLDVKDKGVIKISCTTTLNSGVSYDHLVYVTDTILKTHEHTPGEWQVEKEPTCTSSGKKTISCVDCGEILESENIPATGHKPDGVYVVTKEPTCSEPGTQVQHCTVCGEELDPQPIEKLPHTPSDKWETVKEPTCIEEGIEQRVCTVCGAVIEQEEIELDDHTFSKWAVVSGSMWDSPIVESRICSVCGEVETRENNEYAWFKPVVIAAGALVLIVAGLIVFLLIHAKRKKAAKEYLLTHPVNKPAEPVAPPAPEQLENVFIPEPTISSDVLPDPGVVGVENAVVQEPTVTTDVAPAPITYDPITGDVVSDDAAAAANAVDINNGDATDIIPTDSADPNNTP